MRWLLAAHRSLLISVSQRLSRSFYVCWSLQSAFNFVGSRQDTGLSSCVSVASVCHFLYHIAGVLHLVWRKSVSNVLSFFCVIEESTVLCGILSRIRCVCGILSRIRWIGKSGPVIPTLVAQRGPFCHKWSNLSTETIAWWPSRTCVQFRGQYRPCRNYWHTRKQLWWAKKDAHHHEEGQDCRRIRRRIPKSDRIRRWSLWSYKQKVEGKRWSQRSKGWRKRHLDALVVELVQV